MESINQVFKTNDYDLFGPIDGNRNVNLLHLRRLTESIAEKYITVPIIVNERYQIIDGQHRYEAAKVLDKPVYFIKVKGLQLPDVHRLNTNLKNWSADDYLDGYCMLGNSDYIKYKLFKEEYGFGHDEVKALLSNTIASDGIQNRHFKEGTFKIRNYDLACRNAEKILMVREYYDGYKRRSFVRAMLELFQHSDYNHAEFLQKLSFQSVKLQDCTNNRQYIILIEEIYNYKRSKKDKVRFY